MRERTTSKGWRVGDRIAYKEAFGAAIIEIDSHDRDYCRLRFDDDSCGWHDVSPTFHMPWRRLRSKKITFKESKR